jgi:DNA invertase Pin-like site-specific DNA recombinase
LYLDQQAIDTTTPMGKLVFQLTGAFAEFERTMIRQRVKAGLKRAVAQGVKLGRPKIDSATERKVPSAAYERSGYFEGGQVTRDRDWHGAAHLQRAWLKKHSLV